MASVYESSILDDEIVDEQGKIDGDIQCEKEGEADDDVDVN